MNREQVVTLMETSQTASQWDANCDQVRACCGGKYPDFWFDAVIRSGLCSRIADRWDSSDEIKVREGP